MFFSIIIPVYNTPSLFLRECLESISSAGISKSYEILMINDGSTNEETIAFLESYSEPHTKIITTENRGVSAARNTGMKISTGKYILCLDSDDLLTAEINSALKKIEENPDYDFIYSDQQFFGDNDYYYKKGEFSKFQQIYLNHVLIPSGTIFNRKIAEKYQFNENFSYSEDKDFFSRAASEGSKFLYSPKPFFKYRRIFGNNSLSQKNSEQRHEVETAIKNQFNPHKEITLDEVNRYVLKNFRTYPKHFIKLLLIILAPKLFEIAKKRKIYKNNIVID